MKGCHGPCNQGRCPCPQACQLGDEAHDRLVRAVFWRVYAVLALAAVAAIFWMVA